MKMPRLSPRAADALLALALFLCTLLVLVLLSRLTSMGSHEQRLTAAARAIGLWIDRAAHDGRAVLGHATRDQMLGPTHPFLQLPAFLSGALWQIAAHRHTWWTEPMALRSGFLVFNALSVPLVYLLVTVSWPRRVALLSAALFLLVPRSLHLLVTASADALALVAWLLVACVYVRSIRGGSAAWTLAAGVAIGVGLALSTSVVWLCALLVVHTLWVRRDELRAAAREGSVTVPSALLAALVIAPVVFLLLTPWMWHDTGIRLRQLFTQSLAPSITPGLYGGVLVTAPPLPKAYALRSALLSLPTITVVLTGAGAAVLARRWRNARRDPSLSDPASLGALLLLIGAFTLVWPAISPAVLAVYPPRWLPALPSFGAFAALGLDASVGLAGELLHRRPRWVRRFATMGGVVLALGVPLLESVRSPSTLAAAFAPLTGGAASVIESRTLPVHDASMAAKLAPAIDALGRSSVSMWSPDIPAEVWEVLRTSGRMRTSVRAGGQARDADLLVVSGGATGDSVVRALWLRNNAPPALLQVVERDGLVLLALYRVK